MNRRPLTVAVTGLNATDNPAPGVGVIRALREEAIAGDRVVGLAYDALDPGAYAADLAREVFMIPYPSQGLDAFLSRLEYVHQRVGLDVVIPTLDAELPSFIDIAPRLAEMGIGTCLPTRAQLDLRAKTHLAVLGERAGISVPRTAVLAGPEDLLRVHERVPYPFFVKGQYYGATLATTYEEAIGAYYAVVAQWGLPVLVQQRVPGEEFDVVGVGDGDGDLLGAVPMKKLMLTDKGKGWAGITVKDPNLIQLARDFVRATRWRGPFEVEVMRDHQGRYQLIEVNPRFPAWVYLSVGAGMNLPRVAALLAAGERPAAREDYQVGAMFVRISLDQIARLDDFQSLVTTGELSRDAAS